MSIVTDAQALNFHLMHPGEDSAPGDPNAVFYLDGALPSSLHPATYLARRDLVFFRSRDERGHAALALAYHKVAAILHWTWHVQWHRFHYYGRQTGSHLPRTGIGQEPYRHRQRQADFAWERPYPVEPKTVDGGIPDMVHWDPDCFLIGDTYYAISGGHNPPVMRSHDLRTGRISGTSCKTSCREPRSGKIYRALISFAWATNGCCFVSATPMAAAIIWETGTRTANSSCPKATVG